MIRGVIRLILVLGEMLCDLSLSLLDFGLQDSTLITQLVLEVPEKVLVDVRTWEVDTLDQTLPVGADTVKVG